MKHNQRNPEFKFVKEPGKFNKVSDKTTLQYCLGATLYMPGTKDIVDKILRKEMGGLTSMVMCFEDAIKVEDLEKAEENVINHLDLIYNTVESGKLSIDDIPLIFLRVRNVNQFRLFIKRLTSENASVLTGFVFPKFYSDNAHIYLNELDETATRLKQTLYGMPILEGKTIAFKESRVDELNLLKHLIEPYKELILNVRVGATDFSSIFGVRRGMNSSIYDIVTVRDCLSDILNLFNRANAGYTVSAPVWEYFLAYKKDDIKNLVEKNIHQSVMSRNPIINDAIDGLLREVVLDKANGFVGKTIIHPSHIDFVNGMQAVTREEYEDATQILETTGGVIKSSRSNKMNEINPHKSWAYRIVNMAKAYGVIETEKEYLKFIVSN